MFRKDVIIVLLSKNDPDNYVCYTEEFVPTPAGKETGSYGMPGLDLTILCNDKEQDGIYFYPGKSSSESKNDVSLYIDAVKLQKPDTVMT